MTGVILHRLSRTDVNLTLSGVVPSHATADSHAPIKSKCPQLQILSHRNIRKTSGPSPAARYCTTDWKGIFCSPLFVSLPPWPWNPLAHNLSPNCCLSQRTEGFPIKRADIYHQPPFYSPNRYITVGRSGLVCYLQRNKRDGLLREQVPDVYLHIRPSS